MSRLLYLGMGALAGGALMLLLMPSRPPPVPTAAPAPVAAPITRSQPRTLPAPRAAPAPKPSSWQVTESLPEQLQKLLRQGEDALALKLHRERCRQKPRNAALCRQVFREIMGQLIEENPERLEQLLPEYLAIEVEDPPAVFYQAILYSMRFRYQDALNRLIELQSYPQGEVPAETIEAAFDDIVRQQLQNLRARDDPRAQIEFLQFLTRIESDNPVHFYRLANVQRLLLQHYDALNSLTRIIYDPVWGERAQAMMEEIEQKLQESNQVRVPLVRRQEHFLVRADIGGYGTISLLIDTGASLTVLKQSVSRKLGLPEQGAPQSILMHTPNGDVVASVLQVDYLRIADLPVRDFRFAVLNMENLPEADGLLGMNYLGRFDFYINQDEAVLYLSDRK